MSDMELERGIGMDEGTVVSVDGTRIAYERLGSGPPVVLVGGGLTDRSENSPLVPELALHFDVLNYDRRGRGASDEAGPYSVEREFEDLQALIAMAGGPAHVYGVSSGGALALEAAVAGVNVDSVAVYEVPYNIAGDWPPRWRAYVEELQHALARGDRGAAFEAFMRVSGSPDAEIAAARSSPAWRELEALAHTLPNDAACLGTGRPPVERFARLDRPTLILTGDDRPDGAPVWVRALDPAADLLAATIPGAERRILAGQGHVADPRIVARTLEQFFGR